MTYLTTSWDDGHPLDVRLAGLLSRYGLPGTFYLPRQCEGRPVMARSEARRLVDAGFELGGHTLSHRRLTSLPPPAAEAEIAGCRAYLEDLSGRECLVFAPPGGQFARAHVRMAASAGFRGFRTTELLTYTRPLRQAGIAVIPTTLQAHTHGPASYWKNSLRRGRIGNLLTWWRHGRGGNLAGTFASLLDEIIARHGVMHLWGHSWEIEEQAAWSLVETLFQLIAERRVALRLVANSGLCANTPAREAAA